MKSKFWKFMMKVFRETAILFLGAIASGSMEAIEPHMKDLFVLLTNYMKSD